MDCLDGRDLAQVLEAEGARASRPSGSFCTRSRVLRALQAAHAAGIIHRDMKPSNCFVVTKDGDSGFVKMLDFGISKVQTRAASRSRRPTPPWARRSACRPSEREIAERGRRPHRASTR
ncbi:MAG: hypothetical protein IPQ09_23070 [Myxococcales bacterium]|nr:hypothetical protein [Myxococcales bacterium]